MDAQNLTSGPPALPDHHFEVAFRHLPYGICLIDLEGNIQRVNPQTCLITGYQEEELVGRPMAEIIHDDDVEILTQEVTGMMASGREHVRVEKRFIRKDKTMIWTRSGISVIYRAPGIPEMIMCSLEDISEKKALQKEKEKIIRALAKREREYQALFDFAPDGVAILDETGAFLRVNDKACEIFGYDREEFLTKKTLDLHPEDDAIRAHAQSVMEKVMKTGSGVLLSKFLTKSGAVIYGEISLKSFSIEGELLVQGIFKDITQITRKQRETKEAQARLESIVQAVKARIFLLDIEGTILYSNQRSGRIIKGDFIGKNLLDYCRTQKERDQLTEAMQTSLRTKDGVEYLAEVTDHDGKVNDLHVFMTPMIQDGIVTGFTLLRSDVTSINRANRLSKENAAKLSSVVEAIGARIFHLDIDGIITYSNQKDGRIINGDFLGKKWLDFARTKEERETWRMVLEDCTTKLEPIEYFGQSTYPDGSPKYLLHQIAPVITEGVLTGYTLTRHDITHIQKTNQALLENEARLRSVMETVHSRILQIDLEGTIQYVNRTGNGLELNALVGGNISQFAENEEELRQWEALTQTCREERKPVEFTRRQKYPDGSIRDLLVQMSPVITEDTVVGFTIIRNDITSIEAANRMLRESEENYRSIVEGSDTRIATIGLDDKIIYLNRPFPGFEKEDMIGQDLLKFFPEEGRKVWESLKNQVISTSDATNYEYTFVMPDGVRRSFFDILSPRFHENNIIGFTIISRDVTSTKKLQQEHLKALEVFRTTVDATGIGTYEWDISGTNYISWDDNTHRIFGLEPGEFEGTLDHFLNLVHPEDRPAVEQATYKTLNHLDHANLTYRIILKTGEIRWVSTRRIIKRDEKGNAQQMTGVTWDITASKIREAINLKAARLEAQNQELKEFTYIASHDLQSPLRTIGNFAGILAEDYADVLGATGKEYLDIIQQGIHRMRDLITDLLDYSRIGQEVEREMTDLNILVQAILKDMHHQLSNTGGIVHTHPLPSIPIMKTSFRLLLQNLISNSLKFQAEGVIPKVSIEAVEQEHEYVFSIADNGIGINPDYHQKIFQVFQRLHNHSEYEGTGIGLAHCEKIVALHGGKIWVESEEGKGSTFRFTIPKSSQG